MFETFIELLEAAKANADEISEEERLEAELELAEADIWTELVS